jgi:hypothetical protein
VIRENKLLSQRYLLSSVVLLIELCSIVGARPGIVNCMVDEEGGRNVESLRCRRGRRQNSKGGKLFDYRKIEK